MRTANTLSYVFGALLAASTFAPTASAQQPPAGEQQQPSGEQQPSGQQGMGGQQQQQQRMGQPMAMAAEKMTATATVEKVDKANRRVTLMDDQGKPVTVTVPKDVKRFDELKKGDRVTVNYFESVGVSLKKAEPGAQPSAKEQITTAREGGKLPGGMVARQMSATAIVEKVDPSENTVTIKGPQNTLHTIHITDPAMQKELGNLKPGDKIQATYTEAVAIDVQRPEKQQKAG